MSITPATEMAEKLIALLRPLDGCLVAFSGGVDSSVVAQAARLALGNRAIAITGQSAALAEGEMETAAEVATVIGIRHERVATHELSKRSYASNPSNRCYYCKDELYTRLHDLLAKFNVRVILNGANRDDLGDHRPGMIAASEHQVRSPLAECELTKSDVRQLARWWNLPVWNKPAAPCLASRVAYGVEVTPRRLQMIDRAEQWLQQRGFAICRVRCLTDDVASIEVPIENVARLRQTDLCSELEQRLRLLGFQRVEIDARGFRSGSQNEQLPAELLQIARPE